MTPVSIVKAWKLISMHWHKFHCVILVSRVRTVKCEMHVVIKCHVPVAM